MHVQSSARPWGRILISTHPCNPCINMVYPYLYFIMYIIFWNCISYWFWVSHERCWRTRVQTMNGKEHWMMVHNWKGSECIIIAGSLMSIARRWVVIAKQVFLAYIYVYMPGLTSRARVSFPMMGRDARVIWVFASTLVSVWLEPTLSASSRRLKTRDHDLPILAWKVISV